MFAERGRSAEPWWGLVVINDVAKLAPSVLPRVTLPLSLLFWFRKPPLLKIFFHCPAQPFHSNVIKRDTNSSRDC